MILTQPVSDEEPELGLSDDVFPAGGKADDEAPADEAGATPAADEVEQV